MKTAVSVVALAAFAMTPAMAADPAKINWSKIPVKNETLFYPAQSSYEFLRSDKHPGASVVQTRPAMTGRPM